MKKQDLLILAALIALMLAWPMLYGRLFPSNGARTPPPAEAPARPADAAETAPADRDSPAAPAVADAAEPAAADPGAPRPPETVLTLSNRLMQATFSSRGACLTAVTLAGFRQSVERDSPPVTLDFAQSPALLYDGIPGLASDGAFTLEADGGGLRATSVTAAGLVFTRLISLEDDYRIAVRDQFHNPGGQPALLPAGRLSLGAMRDDRADALGLDILPATGGKGVLNWAKQIPGLFKKQADGNRVPRRLEHAVKEPIDWLAVKNKFFVQILVPDPGAAGFSVLAERALAEGEAQDPARAPKSAQLRALSATADLAPQTLDAGAAAAQSYRLYAGPKKLSILRRLGLYQEDVMAFGFWSPVCKLLLFALNQIHRALPNYGLAIIALTLLIRVLFWPLTHKSTESMKKMQELQPLIADLRKKHKDNPRKLQEETMALYKTHKINPVGGCLPMLIQIPVFIALFVVLRSAIELRFAGFLWIRDLSEPERLLAGLLPIPLNILPILMAAAQAWQQALTPAADPSQQKLFLMFMPVMMLVMFYNMPSALVLYWTANTASMIFQQLLQKKIGPLKAWARSRFAAPAR